MLENRGGERLIDYKNWTSPDELAAGYAAAIDEASHGVATYEQADRLELDDYPVSEDGFHYTDEAFVACLEDSASSSCHVPGLEMGFGYAIDYPAMLSENNICERFNAGEFDELWMFGAPFMGFWEANQAGSEAIWTNGPEVTDSTCEGRLNIMGFSYERGVAEMLEDFGHRSEGTLSRELPNNAEIFSDFTRYEQANPGQSQCGTIHFAPNSESDYDWSNPRQVESYCDNWLSYPDLSGDAEKVDCATWDCDARLHHIWWLSHFPHVTGEAADGSSNNWWSYLLDTGR